MNAALLTSIMATGFTVAFFHAAIPTHWLPFVLAARGQGWGRAKTLGVTALAGLGHVLFTTALGVLVVWAGIETSRWTGDVFPFIAGGVLILVGVYYVVRQMRGGSHGHVHGYHHEEAHNDGHRSPAKTLAKSDAALMLGLLAQLTFSPCEGFLPVYLSGVQYGWGGFVLLSFVLAAATLAGMVAFTWLSLVGMERLKLAAIERYENGILGGLLGLLGLAVMAFER